MTEKAAAASTTILGSRSFFISFFAGNLPCVRCKDGEIVVQWDRCRGKQVGILYEPVAVICVMVKALPDAAIGDTSLCL